MSDFQASKALVQSFYRDLDAAQGDDVANVISQYTAEGFHWRGMHPFYEQYGADDVADVFWRPLKQSFSTLQRRPDVFMAGLNDCDGFESEWVCMMGHLMGLFDHEWLGIPPTGKMAFLRFCEFHRVADGKIQETALFCDVISIMKQAGIEPLPPQTGAFIITPGPKTHDGLLWDAQEPAEGEKTLALINKMISELTGDYWESSEEALGQSWHQDMIWFGPAGIGATYTRERYGKQHQHPFRAHLDDIVFNGHVARFAEGCFGGFFGWANLSMKNGGNFMGLPASDRQTEMRVVDIYRRDGNLLAENWIFIDLLHFLHLQGLDVLGRLREMQPGA